MICFPSIKNGHCYDIIRSFLPEIENAAKGYLESKRLPKLTHVIVAEDDAKYKSVQFFVQRFKISASEMFSTFSFRGTFTMSEIFGVGAKQKATDKINEISAQIKPNDLACVQFTAVNDIFLRTFFDLSVYFI